MSIWTHVAGIVRVEDYVQLANENCKRDFHEIFIESTFDNPNDKCNLPEGSEGSIRFEVIDKPDEYTCIKELIFFGDLRAFGKDDFDKIREWWKNLVNILGHDCYIRNAILEAWSEDDGNLILTQKDIDKTREMKENCND